MTRSGLDVPARPMKAADLLPTSADSDRRYWAKLRGMAAAPHLNVD